MSNLLADLRLALRSLLRAPGFTAAAVLCLALGIGANVTVFSSVYGLLLRPLPFTDPDGVMAVRGREHGDWQQSLSWPDFKDLGTANGAFSATGALTTRTVNLGGVDEPERLPAARITASLLPMVGIQPQLGRTFAPDEELDAKVVLLGDGVWRRRFGADPGVVGHVVLINGEPHTVVGVLPRGVRFPEEAELWLPLVLGEAKDHRDWRWLQVYGRLAPGITRAEANRRANVVMARLAERFPDTNKEVGVVIESFRDDVAREVGPVMMVMMGAVAFVLLIACANVANLLLVRGTTRSRELAVRTALGASRARIVRQLLMEALVLALASGAFGVLVGAWGLDAIVRSLPPDLPYWMRFDINGAVLAFTAGVSLATVLVAGLAPALHVTGTDLAGTLKDGGRGASAGAHTGRLRSALVIGEIALSVVLLVGATLMIRSFVRLRVGDPGFSAREGVEFNMSLAGPRFTGDSTAIGFYDRLVQRLEAVPGVERAALTTQMPIASCCSSTTIFPDGGTGDPRHAPYALYSVVSTGYFATLGIPLLAGRTFDGNDRVGAPRAVVVDRALADRMWPGQNAVGKVLRFAPASDTSSRPLTVVGVVGNVKQRRLTEAWQPHVYVPHRQSPSYRAMEVAVRTRLPASALVRPVREVVRELDPDLPVGDLMTFEERLAARTFDSRIYSSMFGVFGLVALLLASVGLFGVMSYSVAQRRHELGVRLALGAQPRDVMRLVVRQGARLAAIGLVLGVPAAFALARLLRGALYGVTPNDLTSFATVTLLLASVAIFASWVPGVRASRVDPAQALRGD